MPIPRRRCRGKLAYPYHATAVTRPWSSTKIMILVALGMKEDIFHSAVTSFQLQHTNHLWPLLRLGSVASAPRKELRGGDPCANRPFPPACRVRSDADVKWSYSMGWSCDLGRSFDPVPPRRRWPGVRAIQKSILPPDRRMLRPLSDLPFLQRSLSCPSRSTSMAALLVLFRAFARSASLETDRGTA
jgi:hypothetical protein